LKLETPTKHLQLT